MEGDSFYEQQGRPAWQGFVLDKHEFNILLLIANEATAAHLQDLLQQNQMAKFHCTVVPSLVEAKHQLEYKNYDLMLLDVLLMAHDNGVSHLQELDSNGLVPAIMVAEHDDEALEQQFFAEGAQEFLNSQKISAQGIWRAIRHAYIRHRAMQAVAHGQRALNDLAEAMQHGQYDRIDASYQSSPESFKKDKLIQENARLIAHIKDQSEQLQRMARHDHLTDMPNRLKFEEVLAQVYSSSKRHGHMFAVMLMDLDGFKKVNDTYGHQIGDELLRAVAKRFSSRMRKEDFIARVGGDEFAVVISQLKHEHAAGVVAQKLLQCLQIPFAITDRPISIGTSIGIACYPSSGEDIDTLMQNADFAMYNTKSSGGRAYQYSSPEMHDEHLYRLQIEQGLRAAIEQRQFFFTLSAYC